MVVLSTTPNLFWMPFLQAQKDNADVIVFPELVITGYPPEDLLFRPAFLKKVDETLEQSIAKASKKHHR